MTSRHRILTLCPVVTAALLIAGCGSGASSTATNPPAGCTPNSSAYGAVCAVTLPAIVKPATGPANTSPIDGGPVSKGDTVTATKNSISYGHITFWIRDKVHKCYVFDTYSDGYGRLKVWPGSGVLIHFEHGDVMCSTKNSQGSTFHMTATSHTNITMTHDLVFAVLISPVGAVTVQVVAGTLQVSTNTGQGSVTLHAGEQVTVDQNGNIGPKMPLRLTKEEPVAVQRVR